MYCLVYRNVVCKKGRNVAEVHVSLCDMAYPLVYWIVICKNGRNVAKVHVARFVLVYHLELLIVVCKNGRNVAEVQVSSFKMMLFVISGCCIFYSIFSAASSKQKKFAIASAKRRRSRSFYRRSISSGGDEFFQNLWLVQAEMRSAKWCQHRVRVRLAGPLPNVFCMSDSVVTLIAGSRLARSASCCAGSVLQCSKSVRAA